MFGLRKMPIHDLEEFLVQQVKASNIEGVIQALRTLLATLNPDVNKRDDAAYKTLSSAISKASQVVATRTRDDHEIQSLLLSAMMGTDSFNRKLNNFRIAAQYRLEQQQREAELHGSRVFHSIAI